MQLDQSFDVARPIDVVWRGFGDLAATASCIPGAELSEVKDNNKASGVFKIQLGPIKAAFAGEAEVSRDDATHSGTITGAGRDGKNATRVKSTVKYQLEPLSDSATRVNLSVDYNISGPLAQFSRAGIVKEIAGSITKMFSSNLEAMLAASEPSTLSSVESTSLAPAAEPVSSASLADTAAAAAHTTGAARPAASPQSLNLASVVLAVVWEKIKSIFSSQKS
jgi:uncharacterized protein